MRTVFQLVILALLFAFSSSVVCAGWLKIETTNFEIYSEEDEKLTQSLALELERYRSFLIETAGIEANGRPLKLRVYVAEDPSSYRRLSDHKTSAGQFSNRRDGPAAILYHREKSWKYGQDSKQVLFHEYVHYLQYQGTPTPYPIWYQEGLAEYLSSVRSIKGGLQVGEVLLTRIPTLYADDWYHVKKLLEADIVPDRGAVFYGQSWLLTHMLYSSQKFRAGRSAFLNMLAKGTEPLEALRAVYKMEYATLDFALREYFKARKYLAFKFPVGDPGFEIFPAKHLSKEAGEILSLEVRVEYARKDRTNKKLQKMVRQARRKHGALETLDRMEIQLHADQSNWDEAEALAFDRWGGKKHSELEPLSNALFGEVILRNQMQLLKTEVIKKLDPEKVEKARQYLRSAAEVDQRNARARFWLAGSFIDGDQKNYRAAEKNIMEAYALYPQYRRIRYQYVHLLNAEGNYVAACNIARPLYRTAYGEKERKRLKEMIAGFNGGVEACPL